MINYKEKLKHINTFMLDYDGVMTNGIMILMPDDEPLRTANVKDGYALQLAVKKGYHVVIVSGGKSTSVIKRFESLKVDHVFLGVENKLEIFESFLSEHKLKPENVLYVPVRMSPGNTPICNPVFATWKMLQNNWMRSWMKPTKQTKY
jgi:3-deoxy-D-manno-octulosonate 8-phosphate phosphatase (KDO 8-P phosphatase)